MGTVELFDGGTSGMALLLKWLEMSLDFSDHIKAGLDNLVEAVAGKPAALGYLLPPDC